MWWHLVWKIVLALCIVLLPCFLYLLHLVVSPVASSLSLSKAGDSSFQQPRVLQKQHTKLYDLVATFDAFCTRHDIEYFIAYGTLLGAVRHGAFIPWDDDVDLGLTPANIKRLMSKTEQLEDETGIKLYFMPPFPNKLLRLHYENTVIDLMPFHKDSNGNWMNDMFPKRFFEPSELNPLTRHSVGELSLLGPTDPEPFLVRSYGSEWRTPRIETGHVCNQGMSYKLVRTLFEVQITTHNQHAIKRQMCE